MLLMPGIARLSRHHLKALGVKADVISIILGSWTQPPPQGTHIKFERLLTAHNGCQLRQVLTCSASSSDRNWPRVSGEVVEGAGRVAGLSEAGAGEGGVFGGQRQRDF